MGSIDRNRAALGLVGVCGLVVFSYIIFKKIGKQDGEESTKKKKTGHGKLLGADQELIEKKVDDYAVDSTSKVSSEQDSSQSSFVVVDKDGESIPVSSKKSDRSSDTSSFDVVEAEDEETGKRDLDVSLMDEADLSKVQHESDVSSSSFYHSAEETLNKGKNDSRDISLDGKGNTSTGDFVTPGPCDSISSNKSLGPKSDSLSSQPTAAPKGEKSSDSPGSYSSHASVNLTKTGNNAGDGVSQTLSSISFSTSKNASPAQGSETASAKSTASETQGSKSSIPKTTSDKKALPEKELSLEEKTAVLTACQNTPMSVSKDQIHGLVALLKKNEPALHSTVLDSIVRVSGFTQNLVSLQEAGCGPEVSQQVVDSCALALKYGLKNNTQLMSLTKVLTNISMDPKAIGDLEPCVPSLVTVLTETKTTEEVQLSIFRPLINLCAVDRFHSYYIPAIPRLYELLDSGSDTAKLQSCKVLVNLSINTKMVPNMLSAKAPESLMDLLDKPTQTDIVLRVLTLIGNLRGTIAKDKIEQPSLPPENKAESPKTMYTALCGVGRTPQLRNRVYRLSRHTDADIRLQASKLYTLLTMVDK